MVRVREVIVVEGRYDKNTLSQIVDATILETSGFGIFKDKAQVSLLRKVAQTRGLIVLTDSDGAGFVIRNYLKSVLDSRYVKHAFIPDVYGKERRKATPGKEGKLGVEGMEPNVILEALRRAGATMDGEMIKNACEITKLDMVDWGLSGGAGSSQKRKKLLKMLDLPEHMSANAMLNALNLLYTKEKLNEMLQNLEWENG